MDIGTREVKYCATVGCINNSKNCDYRFLSFLKMLLGK
ncbi:unnamed protein product [Callosobruchus maculatus]|uniref:Uncharacterized protein n=1 Tax=Callosobruchus maculatus TaxID=64391 RepID=A0A653D0X3_CALMS|nr:unnamed protein product [Callosobruchus maculatus]